MRPKALFLIGLLVFLLFTSEAINDFLSGMGSELLGREYRAEILWAVIGGSFYHIIDLSNRLEKVLNDRDKVR